MKPPGSWDSQCIAFVCTKAHNSTMTLSGFDWDDGNWPKCGKHGVSRSEIEQVLRGTPAVMADPHPDEPRMRAIGKTIAGRYVFLVFMKRKIRGKTWLRPISARYMHQKEVDHYESQAQSHALTQE
ncbi:BrnT family toxin [Acidithiobacillus ferriphilus]|uniref:BrnT family toxin n=1 Tax=Acidithiobacillus ferriphilus TaxID=1689834 RepID=UPI0027E01DB2|nr:BrnT family toxin [Acidithiobacillus ferriphilus]